jgi:hypothetical protein
MGEKWIRLTMNEGQLYLANKTLDVDVWDGDKKLGILRFGKKGLSWKVGKHETKKVAFSELLGLLEKGP